MATWISRLSLNQRLAAATFVLGAVALFASPYQGDTVSVDTAALTADLGTGADQVAPTELAAWILGGRADYRLIDIRHESAFAQGAIPTAENIPASGLLDAGLQRNEKVIICGDDGTQSAQAWLLLRAKGYSGARLLKGGMTAWRDQVVSPTLAENPTPEQKGENDKLTAIAAYFGGQPRATGDVASGFSRTGGVAGAGVPPAPPAAPKVKPPAAAAVSAKPAPKKKKEGC